ncbi:MAG: saccharopine dehydrogenase NADP-binding domain-containing protein [Candidatus Paceibacterota bacterium]|jgi:shikimate dehydrogenase
MNIIFPNLTLAKLPANNPSSVREFISCGRYTITPIEHDYAGKTATMWNVAYKHFGMDRAMAMMVGESSNAKRILEHFRKDAKYVGGGSGVGFKDENVHHVDVLDPLAKAIGAINLIQKLPSGQLKGWNTDGLGYCQSLEAMLAKNGESLQGKKVIILGAGGTGNAIALTLAERGAHIVILNRTTEKAEELAERINHYLGIARARAGGEELIEAEAKNADVVINVSTKGATGAFEDYCALAPAKLPATKENVEENISASEKIFDIIPRTAIISDIVLRSTPSPFLKRAEELGFTTLNGVPMVINQGVEAFLIIHEKELMGHINLRCQVYEVMKNAANY